MLLCLDGSAGADPAMPVAERRSIEVRFLANEGFAIRGDSAAVLIDAFVAEPFSVYGEVPMEVLREITAGGAPFDEARLALVSHVHADHFQAEVASFYLLKRPDAQICSSPQVIDAIRSTMEAVRQNNPEGLRAPIQSDRLQMVWPQEGASEHRDFGEIRVDFLRLPHGSERHAGIENLGHVIHLNGQRILHLGDATMEESYYEPYDLGSRNLDVALIPYWFFEDASGRATIEKHLKARYTIAMHIPVKEMAEIKERLQKSDPHVIVLDQPMQFMRF